jgi:serine/threonine protein phosphatase 1
MHDVFYFTDVHGQLDLFQTMRDWCYKQDPECMIIYGGDACDRGPFGMDIMEAILDDPQMVYIRGNHEDMFIHAAREIISQYPEVANKTHTIAEASEIISWCHWLHYTELHLYNGGGSTLKDWLIDGASTAFINRLENETVVTFQLDSQFQAPMCFSHAGGSYEAWQRVNDCEYKGDLIDEDDYSEMIWDRSLLNACWPENKIIVFGHTPTCYLHEYTYAKWQRESEMRPVAYRATYNDGDTSGWHIDMDTGMTFYGRGYVLNCLTLDAVGFLDQDVRKQDSKRAVEIGFENFKII